MKNVPLRASIEEFSYENDQGIERWSYCVTGGPVGSPDHLVAGFIWSSGCGELEVAEINLNGLGVPDNLARRFLAVIFSGLCGHMRELDGDVAQYITPDCTAWLSGKMYHADASRILRNLARHTQVTAAFQSTLWVSAGGGTAGQVSIQESQESRS